MKIMIKSPAWVCVLRAMAFTHHKWEISFRTCVRSLFQTKSSSLRCYSVWVTVWRHKSPISRVRTFWHVSKWHVPNWHVMTGKFRPIYDLGLYCYISSGFVIKPETFQNFPYITRVQYALFNDTFWGNLKYFALLTADLSKFCAWEIELQHSRNKKNANICNLIQLQYEEVSLHKNINLRLCRKRNKMIITSILIPIECLINSRFICPTNRDDFGAIRAENITHLQGSIEEDFVREFNILSNYNALRQIDVIYDGTPENFEDIVKTETVKCAMKWLKNAPHLELVTMCESYEIEERVRIYNEGEDVRIVTSSWSRTCPNDSTIYNEFIDRTKE